MSSSYQGKNIQPSKKLSRKKVAPKKKKKHSAKPHVKADNSYISRNTISLLIYLLKTLNNIFSKNVVWIFFIILATKVLVSQTTSISGNDAQMRPEEQQLDLRIQALSHIKHLVLKLSPRVQLCIYPRLEKKLHW